MSDLKTRKAAGNEASIAVHVNWVQKDIRAALREIDALSKALCETTNASKIDRYTAKLLALRGYISELEYVLARYARMASASACEY